MTGNPSTFAEPLLGAGTNADLVRDFFVFFSRFEYALKRAGYFKGNEKRADADWDRFAISLRDMFDPEKSSELNSAVDYLTTRPPQKQVVRNESLTWDPVAQSNGEALPEYVLVVHHSEVDE
jgi:hypothetical protein